MCAHDARGGGEIGGVGRRARGEFGDADGGGVGREDGVRAADLGELGEDLGFEREDLGYGFDYHVDLGEVFEFGGEREAGSDRVRVGLGELLFGYVFAEEFFCEGDAFVEGFLGGVDQCYWDLGSAGSDEGDS